MDKKIRKKKRQVKYPGIGAAAEELGVSRIHLWYVLEGERRSPRIEAWLRRHPLRPQVCEEQNKQNPRRTL